MSPSMAASNSLFSIFFYFLLPCPLKREIGFFSSSGFCVRFLKKLFVHNSPLFDLGSRVNSSKFNVIKVVYERRGNVDNKAASESGNRTEQREVGSYLHR